MSPGRVRIVKVQRPLGAAADTAPWLLYAYGGAHRQFIAADAVPAAVRTMMGDDYRAFFAGVLVAQGRWELSHRVEEQGW